MCQVRVWTFVSSSVTVCDSCTCGCVHRVSWQRRKRVPKVVFFGGGEVVFFGGGGHPQAGGVTGVQFVCDKARMGYSCVRVCNSSVMQVRVRFIHHHSSFIIRRALTFCPSVCNSEHHGSLSHQVVCACVTLRVCDSIVRFVRFVLFNSFIAFNSIHSSCPIQFIHRVGISACCVCKQ